MKQVHDFCADRVDNQPSAHCAVYGCGELNNHPNHTRPIREVIAEVFGPNAEKQIHIHPSYQSAFDKALVEGVRLCSTEGTGDLQFLCGGRVILHLFSNTRATRISYYIVYNDDRGRKWDYERSQGKEYQEIGSRPNERLEFVISC